MPDKLDRVPCDGWKLRYRTTGGEGYSPITYSQKPPQKPGVMLYKLLKDGASSDLRVDGSSTPVAFEVKTASAKQYLIQRVNFLIEDSNIAPAKFGGINNGLTTGLKIEAIAANGTTVLRDFLDGLTIKKGFEFAFLSGSDQVLDAAGTGSDALVVSWDFEGIGGPLHLLEDESLRVTVQDDLLALDSFRIMAQIEELQEATL